MKAKLIISLLWTIPQIDSLSTSLTLFCYTLLYMSVCKVRVHIPVPSPQQLRFWIWLSFSQAKEMEVHVSWWVTSSLFYPFILIPSCFLGNGHDNWSTSSQSGTGKERPQELQSLCPAILGSQPVLRTAFLLMSFTWENKLFCWSHCSQVSITISQILVFLFLLLMMTQGFVQ